MKKKLNFTLTLCLGLTSSLLAFSDTLSFEDKINYKNKSDKISNYEMQNKIKDPSFNYVAVGMALPIPVPGVSLGHREKFSSSAIDFSLGFSTAVVASSIGAGFGCLSYLNEDNFYLGGGGSLGVSFILHEPVVFGVSPAVVFGKENKKSFHEISAKFVSFSTLGVIFFPVASYAYGFKF